MKQIIINKKIIIKSLKPYFYCILLLTTSCSTAIETYHAPVTSHLHDQNFKSYGNLKLTSSISTTDYWWEDFNDPALNTLVSLALENNKDIQAAAHRVTAARLGQLVQKRESHPILDINISNTTSSNDLDNSDLTNSRNPLTRTFLGGFQLNGFLSWEYDLIGRLKTNAKIAQTNTDISHELRRDTMQLVANQVVTAYIEFRSAQSQLNTIKKIKAKREEGLALLNTALQLGVTTNYEQTRLLLDNSEVENTESDSKRLRAIALYRLETLTSSALPAEIINSQKGIEVLNTNLALPIQSPEIVIRQRPDIRIAERQLAIETYEIGQAITEYYPRINVFGDFEPLSNNSISLSQIFGFGIRDFRLVGARIGEQKATTKAALANFDSTVLRALEEVETSLTTLNFANERLRNETNRLSIIQKSKTQMQDMLSFGLSTRQQFLTVEIEELEIEQALEDAKADRITAYAQVYRAFGGEFHDTQAKTRNNNISDKT